MAHDLIRQEIGTKRAGEDMTAARGKAVVFNSLDRWQIAGLTGPFAGLVQGILTNNPANGGVASVQVFGVAMAKLGGTVTGGRYLDVDANGDLIENHPGGTIAVALESGIAGSLISVFLIARAPAISAEPYILIRDEKASSTDGGTFTSGAYRTRTLNTTVVDTDSNVVSLASDQIELTAGTYRFRARAPAKFVTQHKIKLRNVTDAADILIGSVSFSQSTGSDSFVTGRFTIAAGKDLEVQHRCTTTGMTTGFGQSAEFGDIEVYAEIEFWKEL